MLGEAVDKLLLRKRYLFVFEGDHYFACVRESDGRIVYHDRDGCEWEIDNFTDENFYEIDPSWLPCLPREKTLREKIEVCVKDCLKAHAMLDRTIPAEVDGTVDKLEALLGGGHE